MRNNIFFKFLLLLVSTSFLISCDKDYNEVGDALIGDNHFDLEKKLFSITAYNQKTGPIQSNNLPVNALGIYNNPAFGNTTANFVTELVLASVNPVIGANAEIDSVYLDIPYFVDATKTKSLASGGNTYELDSIYGNKLAKIKLSIFESGRYMGKQDGVSQLFYTNQNTEFNSYKIGSHLNDAADPAENDAFFFNPAQRILTTEDDDEKKTNTYLVPGMRLRLNSTFFKTKILEAPSGKLSENDVFKEYFRGLYFKVEQSGSDPGSLAMINFSKGTITINYKEDLTSTDANNNPVVSRVAKSITLNMTSNNLQSPVNTASLLENSNENSNYTNAINSPDKVLGDEKLYLKGGEGSLVVLDLFDKTDIKGYNENGTITGPNGISDELDDIRKNKWLINEASIILNIDADDTNFKNSYEPDRIYLYDLTDNTTILDYYLDSSTSSKNTSKLTFGGRIQRNPNSIENPKRGVSYKFNITRHIRNLVKNADATNIKLGVVVTEDINIATSYKVLTPTDILKAPAASVMNPLGTILYGNNTTDENKRIKFQIYYTKPKPN